MGRRDHKNEVFDVNTKNVEPSVRGRSPKRGQKEVLKNPAQI